MEKTVVLVLDCGATNIRTVAVTRDGQILTQASLPNSPSVDPDYEGYLIWDVQELWSKLKETTTRVIKQLAGRKILAVTVTTFGVDGTFFDDKGSMLYPVISWQCSRTEPILGDIDVFFDPYELYSINGVQPFSFNTIYKLIWFKKYQPEILKKAKTFLFLPSIFLYYLSGKMVTDSTMAGTSMLTDLNKRNFSDTIFNKIGIEQDLFPELLEPGSLIGQVLPTIEQDMGIPEGTPVVAAGHDTQFALFGSGAGRDEPILSSGTWEILMARTHKVNLSKKLLDSGLTIEFDSAPGLVNPGLQWIASGTLEWIADLCFNEVKEKEEQYALMIAEASQEPPGCNGLFVNPDFLKVSQGMSKGIISGLHMNTKRGAIYRSTLESLAFKLKKSLTILESTCGFKSEKLLCVGGGSKNALWNQIRSDVLALPVQVIDQKETTVLGAALYALAGIDAFASAEEARSTIKYKGEQFTPGKNAEFYNLLWESYSQIL